MSIALFARRVVAETAVKANIAQRHVRLLIENCWALSLSQ